MVMLLTAGEDRDQSSHVTFALRKKHNDLKHSRSQYIMILDLHLKFNKGSQTAIHNSRGIHRQKPLHKVPWTSWGIENPKIFEELLKTES